MIDIFNLIACNLVKTISLEYADTQSPSGCTCKVYYRDVSESEKKKRKAMKKRCTKVEKKSLNWLDK